MIIRIPSQWRVQRHQKDTCIIKFPCHTISPIKLTPLTFPYFLKQVLVLLAHGAHILHVGTVKVYVPLMNRAGLHVLLHGEVGGVIQIHVPWFKIAVYSTDGCCTATTMSLTSIVQKCNRMCKYVLHIILMLPSRCMCEGDYQRLGDRCVTPPLHHCTESCPSGYSSCKGLRCYKQCGKQGGSCVDGQTCINGEILHDNYDIYEVILLANSKLPKFIFSNNSARNRAELLPACQDLSSHSFWDDNCHVTCHCCDWPT